MLWFWLLVGPALALALFSLRGEKRRAAYYAEYLAVPKAASLPPATVMVPVKGPDEGLKENLASLASLDYPDYELLVVARSAADVPDGVVPGSARVVLAGEPGGGTGEKVQNLLAGIEASRASSEIFAFADSDGRVGKQWLRALVTALEPPGAGASTGYRWYLPDPPNFWSLLRSVWNAVIAGRFGPDQNDFAWGGAMAIRRETFHRCRVPDYWHGAVSDDYRLSDAIRECGLRIHFAPGAMVASTDHATAREFLSWIRRQMVITRVYRPKLWRLGLVSHLIYCAATVACIAEAVRGHLLGEYMLVALWGLGMLKGANRAAMAKAALPDYQQWFKRYGWVHTWWVPLVTWVWMYSFIASAFSNEIRWRGTRYRLSRPTRL